MGMPDSEVETGSDQHTEYRATRMRTTGGVDLEDERRRIREGLERLRQAKKRRDDSRVERFLFGNELVEGPERNRCIEGENANYGPHITGGLERLRLQPRGGEEPF